jgi:hypothetical protein
MFKAEFYSRRIIQTGFGFFIFPFLCLGLSISAQISEKNNFIETSAKPAILSSTKIRLDDETLPPHTLVGGYYSLRNGLESKLLLNNKAPQPMEVQPTLYGRNGAILQLASITIDAKSSQFVNLRDWANIGGEGFQEGSVKLFHRGKDLALGTQIQITDESKSLIFESKLSELGKFDSRHFESVWWIPNNDTDSIVVLTNTSEEFLTVTATLTRKPHVSGSPHTFYLLPHEIKVLNVREDFNQGNVFARSKVLGLSLSHGGSSDSLLAWTMIRDDSKGYSNVATFSNPAKAESNQWHGAGLQLGSVGSDRLEPVVVLSNTTDSTVNVNVKVPYTRNNGTRSSVSVNNIRLRPREVYQVNMQNVANLANIRTAGIEIDYTGEVGGVIASAQSVSESGNQVFRTLLWNPPTVKSAASLYPFYIEGTSSTKAYVKNAGFKDEYYISHLTWGIDGEYIIPIASIKKGETIEIDVKKLRDEQIPDEQGRTIPFSITKGQIHWSLHRSEATLEEAKANRVPLVGQAMQIDTARGISYSYFCVNCCAFGGAFSYGTMLPGNLGFQHPNSYQYQIVENGQDCYGNRISDRNVTVLAYDWTSTSTNVATVNGSGFVTSTGAGTTQIRAKIRLPRSMYFGYCDPGGPYFAEGKGIEEKCNEGSPNAEVKDTQTVSFSNISFKRESKPNVALRPDDCDCITTSPSMQESASLTVYQIVIKRDGQPVTASNNKTITGERINLTAEILPSGTAGSNHSWTAQGSIIKTYSPTPQNYQVGSTVPAQLNISNPDFIWVDGGNGRRVAYSARVNGQTFSAQVFFDVARPTTQINATSTVQTATDTNSPSGNYEVHLGSGPSNPGIRFNRGNTTVPSPFTGTFQWVQVIDSLYINAYDSNGNNPGPLTKTLVLDQEYPYGTVTNEIDSPGLGVACCSISIGYDTTFSMYLMFKPSGNQAEWVPLRKVTWRWAWTSLQNNSLWQTTVSTEPRNQNLTDSDTTSHPTWGSVFP